MALDNIDSLIEVKACYDDQGMSINGRVYKLTITTHKKRLKLFSYLTKIQSQLELGRFDFLGTLEWTDEIEPILSQLITINDLTIAKSVNYWDKPEVTEDYLKFVVMGLMVYSYPFLKGNKQS